MNHEVEQIKRLISIGDLLGTQKKRIPCPLPSHPDKHPSCDVDHEAGLWHCKVCDQGGDIFNLIMLRDRFTFPEALAFLADKAGVQLGKPSADAQARWEQEQRAGKAIAYAAVYYHQALLDSVGGKAWTERRGFTVETLQRLQIGIADGNLVRSIKRVKLEEMGLSIEDFIKAGLIYEVKNQPGTHRDYFQNRIIFPLKVRGRIVNLTGRAMVAEDDPKYLHLKNRPNDHFYNEDAIGDDVWLFEGHPDTVTGIQLDLPAVGVVGTGGMVHPERLQHAKRIWICGDADRAGRDAIGKWATAILKYNPGVNLLFVSLPGPGKDFNDYFLHERGPGFAGKLEAITKAAKNLIDYKISLLQSSDDLVNVWPLLQSMPEISREGVFIKIKNHLKGCGVKLLRKSFKDWNAARIAESPETVSTVEGETFHRGSGPLPSNVGFVMGKERLQGHVCLFADVHRNLDGKTVTAYEPVAIRSNLEADTGVYQAELLYLVDRPEFSTHNVPMPHVVNGRWSPDGIQRFRDSSKPENTAALLKDLRDYFQRYIWHRDPITYEVLALYSMGTYVARLFQAYPYLSFNGLAGSGKTNTLELLAEVCFNAILAANTSLAAMFRLIEKCFATYIRDEAEQFNKKTPENQDELLVLNSGYKASGVVSRVEKGKNGEMDVQNFNVYSPKIFAGINMLNDTLLTRSILVTMHKAPRDQVRKLVSMSHHPEEWKGQASALRDRLYSWALTQFHLVSQAYQDFPAQDKIVNRDWEVWSPLLAIAILADNDDENPADEPFSLRVLRFAEGKVKEKKDHAKDNAIEQKVLDTILLLMDEQEVIDLFGHDGWFVMATVAKSVSTKLVEEGYFKDTKEISPRWLMKILEQTQVITDRESQVKQIKENVTGKNKKCIYMPRATIEGALANL